MAVAFDSAFEGNGTTSVTVGCTPVGTIRGCLVFVVTNDVDDDVTGVTAGGNAMTEVPSSSVLFTEAGDVGAVSAWFYGSNLGADPFNVVVSAGSGTKWVGVVLLTAAADTEINDDDASQAATTENPSGTLALASVESFCAVGWWSAINAPASVTPLTNWTNQDDHDFGADIAGVYTYDIVSTTDVTYGFTAGSNDYAMIGVAISEAGTTVAITGTLADNATEAEVVTGGETAILTLTGDTWVASGATFDAQRQAIIDGFDSAQSELTGWNNEVRDKEVVTAVVRTSDTVVTVTLSASASYDITAHETITVTVPAAALVTSASPVVANETFQIIASVVSTHSAGINRGLINCGLINGGPIR